MHIFYTTMRYKLVLLRWSHLDLTRPLLVELTLFWEDKRTNNAENVSWFLENLNTTAGITMVWHLHITSIKITVLDGQLPTLLMLDCKF